VWALQIKMDLDRVVWSGSIGLDRRQVSWNPLSSVVNWSNGFNKGLGEKNEFPAVIIFWRQKGKRRIQNSKEIQ